MLNTFENADKQHRRRLEREEHLRNLAVLSNTLEWSDSTLVSITDGLSGDPLQRTMTLAPETSKLKNPKLKKLLCVLGASILVMVLALAFTLGIDVGEKEMYDDMNEHGNMQSQGLERKNLFNMILEWGVTPRSTLGDVTSSQSRAMEWLLFEDNYEHGGMNTIKTRYALATLYFSTQDADNVGTWEQKRHWLSSHSVCLWYGVECSDTDESDKLGLIKSLDLSSNGLVGVLPNEIGLLGSEMVSLDVSDNAIEGTIPWTLHMMKNLANLYLGPNEFSSSLPSTITELTELTHFYANDCSLSGTIPDLSKLTKLEGLGIHENMFTGSFPSSIEKLTALQVLYLDSNQLSGEIPSEIGSTLNLIDIRLRDNMFSGVIPSQIGGLEMLQILYLDSNDFTGWIPEQLGNNKLLHELHLYDNGLSGALPESIMALPLVRVLYADSNILSGQIPTTIGAMEHLESLFLFGNQLSGKIPSEMGMAQALTQVRLNDNKLTGEIPTELATLQDLDTLFLQNNTLTGPVSEVFGGIPSLQKMRLHGNSLTGSIPMKICVAAAFNLHELTADCDFSSPEISCKCCSKCYHD